MTLGNDSDGQGYLEHARRLTGVRGRAVEWEKAVQESGLYSQICTNLIEFVYQYQNVVKATNLRSYVPNYVSTR